MSRTVVITGAAGYLGGLLRAGLGGGFRLRLTDRAPLPAPVRGTEEFQQADLGDREALGRLMKGADAVVHLAGVLLETAPWEEILSANIAGAYNVFEAARRSGVKRVVYASSHHVVGFYRRGRRVRAEDPVRPDSRYGVSKVFGEALGRLYADKYGLSVVCQRIGVARPRPPHPRSLSNWISERDYVALTRRCLEAPDVHFVTVFGVSGGGDGFYDNAAAAALGFVPRDNADDYRREILARADPEPAPGAPFQGGYFCAYEFEGDPGRVD